LFACLASHGIERKNSKLTLLQIASPPPPPFILNAAASLLGSDACAFTSKY